MSDYRIGSADMCKLLAGECHDCERPVEPDYMAALSGLAVLRIRHVAGCPTWERLVANRGGPVGSDGIDRRLGVYGTCPVIVVDQVDGGVG